MAVKPGAADGAAAPRATPAVKLSLWVGKLQKKYICLLLVIPPCVRGFSLTTQGVLCLVLSFLPVGLVTPPSLSVLEDVSEVQNIQGEEKD